MRVVYVLCVYVCVCVVCVCCVCVFCVCVVSACVRVFRLCACVCVHMCVKDGGFKQKSKREQNAGTTAAAPEIKQALLPKLNLN